MEAGFDDKDGLSATGKRNIAMQNLKFSQRFL
jgi:hypothetical protein